MDLTRSYHIVHTQSSLLESITGCESCKAFLFSFRKNQITIRRIQSFAHQNWCLLKEPTIRLTTQTVYKCKNNLKIDCADLVAIKNSLLNLFSTQWKRERKRIKETNLATTLKLVSSKKRHLFSMFVIVSCILSLFPFFHSEFAADFNERTSREKVQFYSYFSFMEQCKKVGKNSNLIFDSLSDSQSSGKKQTKSDKFVKQKDNFEKFYKEGKEFFRLLTTFRLFPFAIFFSSRLNGILRKLLYPEEITKSQSGTTEENTARFVL